MNEKTTEKYYEILELNAGASQDEIKDAYRDLAKVWHPDRFSHDSKLQNKAEEKLRQLNEAYEKLRSSNNEPDNSSDEVESPKNSYIITTYQEKWFGVKSKTETSRKQNKQHHQTKSKPKYYQAKNQTKGQKYPSTQKESSTFAEAKKARSKSALLPSLLGVIIFGIFIVFVLRSSSPFPENPIPAQSTINQTETKANKNLNGKSGVRADSKAKESDSLFQVSARSNPDSTKSAAGQISANRNTTDSTIRSQMLSIQNSITKGTNKSHRVAIGSTKDEVLGAYGYPGISSKNEFHYNNKVIYFDNDRVSGAKQIPQESRIILRTQ